MKYIDTDFYSGKRVFVTGHTGFKGSWLCQILLHCGAAVTGYALPAPTEPSLFDLAGLQKNINSITGDIRDMEKLQKAFKAAQPDIVLHLAAQPLVRESYKEPVYTYETNVMGTVNLLECVRTSQVPVKSVVNVTTDKVYKNNEWIWGYREDEPLDGFDPYSNSKSCSELVTHSYVNSFFVDSEIAISTARAGNVIGGGDFAADRMIPERVRAAPDECDCVTTGALVNLFAQQWGNAFSWLNQAEADAPHEANFLKLDCSKLKATFGWQPRWHIKEAVAKTVDWSKICLSDSNVVDEMDKQIKEYMGAQG